MTEIYLDKYDRIIACSSGVLAASVDMITRTEFGWDKAHGLGDRDVKKLINILASDDLGDFLNALRNKSNTLSSIRKLEKNKIKSDNYKKYEKSDKFGGANLHHLQDFAHHPTPVGLLCAILSEFTGGGYGTNNKGEFVPDKISDIEMDKIPEIVFKGALKWALHLMSDIAGSSGSYECDVIATGTGIPGPLLSTLKELSAIPGIRSIMGTDNESNYVFAKKCEDLFDGGILGTRFDYRTEIGIKHIAINQAFAVLLCEGILCAFYSVKQLWIDIKEKNISSLEELKQLNFSEYLPWHSYKIKRLRTISSITFSAIDGIYDVQTINLSLFEHGEDTLGA